jgi:hypothetical protein
MAKFLYIYSTKKSADLGLIKIGDAYDVHQRIQEQLNTASVFDASALEYSLLYQTEALKNSGAEFRDHDIHAALIAKGYPKHQITSGVDTLKGTTEWFKIDLEKAIHLIDEFKKGKQPEEIDIERYQDFPMRPEQQRAVDQTIQYFAKKKAAETLESLWNAKMRFGKTFTAYQLMRKMGWSKVLILTYKPAVEDAWKKDLESHVDFKGFVFLRGEAISRSDEYLNKSDKVVVFASYQDILGDDADGKIKAKHFTLYSTNWDAVIIDEFHYGAGTKKAKEVLADTLINAGIDDLSTKALEDAKTQFFAEEDEALTDESETEIIVELLEKRVKADFRLYLSGTPFKAMANAQFPDDAIFNWTYPDEQRAKEQWNLDHPGQELSNPYRSLPQIKMFLYKVSDDLIKAGVEEGRDEFSLNHFFKAKHKKFLNQTAVTKWLDLISGIIKPHVEINEELIDEVRLVQSQYPFDKTTGIFNELDHTLWYLSRVDSAYALRDLLKEHPVFRSYHIILAAGKELGSGIDAVQPVLDAIEKHERTITISVGKLTTGVSVPKWKGVMFLRDVASPENYFQTAFRAQTPYKDNEGKYKQTCYIFDFSPNRSLKLLTTYSEKLTSNNHKTTSEQRLSEFIRYLPVLKVTGNQMVAMDAREVLTFDLTGVDAKGLAHRFMERRNVVVNSDTINAINASEDTRIRCQSIFDKIKKFRKFNGASEADLEKSDVDLANLDVNDKKIKELKTKEDAEPKKEKAQVDKAEKEVKSEREKIRELLRTLLSRLPIFMYLTDATEENLDQVLIDDEDNLFRKTTGIEIVDFRFLIDVGLLKIDSIDGYILKFVTLENQNFQVNNNIAKQ